MSLFIKAIAILLLVSCTIAAPVEDQSPVVNVELPSNDDSAPIDLPSIEIVENDPLLRTKRQFGFGDLFGGLIGVGYGGGYNNYGNYGNRYGNGGYGGNYNGYNGYNNYNNGYGHGGYDGHHHHHDDYHGHGHYDYDDHYDHHHHH